MMSFDILTSDGSMWFVNDYPDEKTLRADIKHDMFLRVYRSQDSQPWVIFGRNVIGIRDRK